MKKRGGVASVRGLVVPLLSLVIGVTSPALPSVDGLRGCFTETTAQFYFNNLCLNCNLSFNEAAGSSCRAWNH